MHFLRGHLQYGEGTTGSDETLPEQISATKFKATMKNMWLLAPPFGQKRW